MSAVTLSRSIDLSHLTSAQADAVVELINKFASGDLPAPGVVSEANKIVSTICVLDKALSDTWRDRYKVSPNDLRKALRVVLTDAGLDPKKLGLPDVIERQDFI